MVPSRSRKTAGRSLEFVMLEEWKSVAEKAASIRTRTSVFASRRRFAWLSPDGLAAVQTPVGNEAFPSGNGLLPAGNVAFPSGNEAFPLGNEALPAGNAAFPSGNGSFLAGNEAFPLGN